VDDRTERVPSRIVWIDLARALAVLLMVQGHALDVLLAPTYRSGLFFDVWMFVRGLVSCLFLFLAGLSFVIASDRRLRESLHPGPRLWRRLRRLLFFFVLGYAMHFPVGRLSDLAGLSEGQVRAFSNVDILQLVSVSVLALQGMLMLTRRWAPFSLAAASVGAIIVLAAPAAWRIDWTEVLPIPLAAYLSSGTGSLFPLLPWAAFPMLGAVVGVLVISPAGGTDRLPAALAGLGAVMALAGWSLRHVPLDPFGPLEFWDTSPNLFLIRAGPVVMLLGVMAWISRGASRLPAPVQALAEESLLIYFVHVCVLYGSIWNVGLAQLVGPVLDNVGVAAWTGLLFATMLLLGWGWNACKRRRPEVAGVIRPVVMLGAALVMLF